MRTRLLLPLVAMFLLLPALPAAAHVHLVATTPDDGETLDEAPSEIVLAFDGPLLDEGSVTVTGPEGIDVATGDPAIDEERAEVSVDAEWIPGEYHVQFDLVAGDGHDATGEFTFNLTDAAATVPAVPEPDDADDAEPTEDAEPADEPEPTDDAEPTEAAEPTDEPEPTEDAEPADADDTELTAATDGEDGGIWPVVIAVVVIGGILAGVAIVMNKRRDATASGAGETDQRSGT